MYSIEKKCDEDYIKFAKEHLQNKPLPLIIIAEFVWAVAYYAGAKAAHEKQARELAKALDKLYSPENFE